MCASLYLSVHRLHTHTNTHTETQAQTQHTTLTQLTLTYTHAHTHTHTHTTTHTTHIVSMPTTHNVLIYLCSVLKLILLIFFTGRWEHPIGEVTHNVLGPTN